MHSYKSVENVNKLSFLTRMRSSVYLEKSNRIRKGGLDLRTFKTFCAPSRNLGQLLCYDRDKGVEVSVYLLRQRRYGLYRRHSGTTRPAFPRYEIQTDVETIPFSSMTVSGENIGSDKLMSTSAYELMVLFWEHCHGGSYKHGFVLGKTFSTVSRTVFFLDEKLSILCYQSKS